MVLNPALSARLSRAGIVAQPDTSYQGDALLLKFKLAEVDGDLADQPSRVPGAAQDRSILDSGSGWIDRWRAECDRADAVVCADFGIAERSIFVKDGHVVVHFSTQDRAESCRWLEGFGWIGW